MELQTYLAILWRRKVTLVATTLIVLIGAAVATFLTRPTYISATTLRAITIGGDALSGRTDPVYTERLLSTYAAIVTGGTVLNELTQRFNLPQRPVLSVDLVRGTELMRIRAQATDPAITRELDLPRRYRHRTGFSDLVADHARIARSRLEGDVGRARPSRPAGSGWHSSDLCADNRSIHTPLAGLSPAPVGAIANLLADDRYCALSSKDGALALAIAPAPLPVWLAATTFCHGYT